MAGPPAALLQPIKPLKQCTSVQPAGPGNEAEVLADLCLHPLGPAKDLTTSQSAANPRYGPKEFLAWSSGGRRHALCISVNYVVEGLSPHIAELRPGWSRVSPAELSRYMLWAGYDTLYLKDVPIMQAHAPLGKWKQLEVFVEKFSRTWESQANKCTDGFVLAGGGGHHRGGSITTAAWSKTSGGEPRAHANNPQSADVTSAVLNPLHSQQLGSPGDSWGDYIRSRTASILVENGDSFVHHAFKSRSLKQPFWFAVQGIVLRNRHLDAKGLYSHAYSSAIFKSRTQISTLVNNYVEDESAEALDRAVQHFQTLWVMHKAVPGEKPVVLRGLGGSLAVFSTEQVDANVVVDPRHPPKNLRGLPLGEEFTEAGVLQPRPFSTADIGHWLRLMQEKAIPAAVEWHVPPELEPLRGAIFGAPMQSQSMAQFVSDEVVLAYKPNRPIYAGGVLGELTQRQVFERTGMGKHKGGVRFDRTQRGGLSKTAKVRQDLLVCPNLKSFLDTIHQARVEARGVKSDPCEEEQEWVAYVAQELRAVVQACRVGAEDGTMQEGSPAWLGGADGLLSLLEACQVLAEEPEMLRDVLRSAAAATKRTTNTRRMTSEGASMALEQVLSEDPLDAHWADVESLGVTDTLKDSITGDQLLEDAEFSTYLEYCAGQPVLGTRSSARVVSIVLANLKFLVKSKTIVPLHFDEQRCSEAAAQEFKGILAQFAALAKVVDPTNSSSSADGDKDTAEAVRALCLRVGSRQIRRILSAIAVGGGARPPKGDALSMACDENGAATKVKVYVVERQVLSFTGTEEVEEHFQFHAVHAVSTGGLTVFVAKEHPNKAAAVLWCYLRTMGMPTMLCHLAECMMDRTLKCQWDSKENDGANLFQQAGLPPGAARLAFTGDLEELSLISRTVKDDLERTMTLREKMCFLRMIAHGHKTLSTNYPEEHQRELPMAQRIVSVWRQTIVGQLRAAQSSRGLTAFLDHLRVPTMGGTEAVHEAGAPIDPRVQLWWTCMSLPWNPSAGADLRDLLTVVGMANSATNTSPGKRGLSAAKEPVKHGLLRSTLGDVVVSRMCTSLLVRQLLLQNREESPFPPDEPHYQMVALELRGEDKTRIHEFLQTDPSTLGEVLNRAIRKDCLASDHSEAFLAENSLGTLHEVKYGQEGKQPAWKETSTVARVLGGPMNALRKLVHPKDTPGMHGYSVGIYYSMPVLVEVLLQVTRAGSIYSNESVGTIQDVAAIALMHSLVAFGGLALGAGKISSMGFYSWMVVKLVQSQTIFLTAFLVLSTCLLPLLVAVAFVLWRGCWACQAVFVAVFIGMGGYILLVSLLLPCAGGRPWSKFAGQILLLAHSMLLVAPLLSLAGLVPEDYQSLSFLGGVVVCFAVLVVGFVITVRRLYEVTKRSTQVVLSDEDWTTWKNRRSGENLTNQEQEEAFYARVSGVGAVFNAATRKRRWGLLSRDMEEYLMEFDAIRNSQVIPKERWGVEWDRRLKRAHQDVVDSNYGMCLESAATLWAACQWDVCYGTVYFAMSFSDFLVNMWTKHTVLEADTVFILALLFFTASSAGLESVMMKNLMRPNGHRRARMDPNESAIAESSKVLGRALSKLYYVDLLSYMVFILFVLAVFAGSGYLWLVPADYDWDPYHLTRACAMASGYGGILIGLFHKILFGGSAERQKAACKVAGFSLAVGMGSGIIAQILNDRYKVTDNTVSFVALGVTGFTYALLSIIMYRSFKVQLSSQGFASGQLLAAPSLGTAGQRALGVGRMHLPMREAVALDECRRNGNLKAVSATEMRDVVRRALFRSHAGSEEVTDPQTAWTKAPGVLRVAFGNRLPRNEAFFRWKLVPVADQYLLSHGFHAMVDPARGNVLYVSESTYRDHHAMGECLMHETFEWAYGSHKVGVMSELLLGALPARMRLQMKVKGAPLATIVHRTMPCIVDAFTMGCCKDERVWQALSPHAREVVIRTLLTVPPALFEVSGSSRYRVRIRDDPVDPDKIRLGHQLNSEVAISAQLGCRHGAVIRTAMLELSIGRAHIIEAPVALAQARLLAGLSQCVNGFAMHHLASITKRPEPSAVHGQALLNKLEVQLARVAAGKSGMTGRGLQQTTAEAILAEKGQIFSIRRPLSRLGLLFSAATGCAGFHREAFARTLDRTSLSLPALLLLHRWAERLFHSLFQALVLKHDKFISELIADIQAIPEPDPPAPAPGFAETYMSSPAPGGVARVGDVEGGMGGMEEATQRLVDQRAALEEKIRGKELPVGFVPWLDSMVLRKEPLLREYWAARDSGKYLEALLSLNRGQRQLHNVLLTGAHAGLSSHIDLATFARAGSTRGVKRASSKGGMHQVDLGITFAAGLEENGLEGHSSEMKEEQPGVDVIALDSGTWPQYGGGVAVCRAQLLDKTAGRIRWHSVYEVAALSAVPLNMDIPCNMFQMLAVPLWSQNMGGGYESFLGHTTHLTRNQRVERTTPANVRRHFVPVIRTLIDLSNTPADTLTVMDLEHACHAIADMYCYFQVFDWEATWKSGVTHQQWAAQWLACGARDRQRTPLLRSERPSLGELHEILNYWMTFLTCLQVDLPKMNSERRGVIHVSHHGTQALLGVAAKRLCGWSLVVWDHGMLWRERCKAICELNGASVFVRKSIACLHRLVAKSVLYSADSLTPCTATNETWERRTVSDRDRGLQSLTSRKVSAVLNGAPSSITPNQFLEGMTADGENKWVTGVMLSHVYKLKGVMTAIQAADLIVNTMGFKRYRLLVYGSLTHDTVYAALCQEMIERLCLENNVRLCGKGRPTEVLAQGDMFLNSSVSEGLPLAIIEASRAGLVVCATDVGGTRDVVGEYGSTAPPNSPRLLARAQLEALAVCDKWCKPDGFPNLDWGVVESSPDPAAILDQAIFNPDVIKARHAWGMRYRNWTCQAFSLDRYRDEHVRAMTIADRQAKENAARLTLRWAPCPKEWRLAHSYTQLRHLLDLCDVKEHTFRLQVQDIASFQAKVVEGLSVGAVPDLSTDPDHLALMDAFRSDAHTTPLLHWWKINSVMSKRKSEKAKPSAKGGAILASPVSAPGLARGGGSPMATPIQPPSPTSDSESTVMAAGPGYMEETAKRMPPQPGIGIAVEEVEDADSGSLSPLDRATSPHGVASAVPVPGPTPGRGVPLAPDIESSSDSSDGEGRGNADAERMKRWGLAFNKAKDKNLNVREGRMRRRPSRGSRVVHSLGNASSTLSRRFSGETAITEKPEPSRTLNFRANILNMLSPKAGAAPAPASPGTENTEDAGTPTSSSSAPPLRLRMAARWGMAAGAPSNPTDPRKGGGMSPGASHATGSSMSANAAPGGIIMSDIYGQSESDEELDSPGVASKPGGVLGGTRREGRTGGGVSATSGSVISVDVAEAFGTVLSDEEEGAYNQEVEFS